MNIATQGNSTNSYRTLEFMEWLPVWKQARTFYKGYFSGGR